MSDCNLRATLFNGLNKALVTFPVYEESMIDEAVGFADAHGLFRTTTIIEIRNKAGLLVQTIKVNTELLNSLEPRELRELILETF